MGFIDSLPDSVSPTLPNLAAPDFDLDELCDDMLRRYRQDVRGDVGDEKFDNRFSRATMFVLPYLSQRFDARKLRALEVGCGSGAKAFALGQLFHEYVGVDIMPVKEAERIGRRFGLRNVSFESVEAAQLAGFLARQPAPFDVIILYAVLEHLTVDEKLDLLKLCWEYLGPSGYLFIGEAPNRMVPTDFHSTYLPYFQGMPLDLWRLYYDRSPAKAWKRAMSKSVADKAEFELKAFRRGLHVGHQEFELGLPEIGRLSDHTVGDNFAVEMLNLYPYTTPEFLTLCQLDQLASPPPGSGMQPLDLPPAFSRYYIEAVLSKGPVATSADQSALRVLAPGEAGTLSNRKFAPGRELAAGQSFVIGAEMLPDGAAPMIDVTLTFERPHESGDIEVMTAKGDVIADFGVSLVMRSISKRRASLAVKLPSIERTQFPLAVHVRRAPTVLSYVFLQG